MSDLEVRIDEAEKVIEKDDGPDDTNDSSRIIDRSETILFACANSNLEVLSSIACLPGGFLNDELRKKAWQILLGHIDCPLNESTQNDWHELPRHKDEAQVELDVNRSFVYYPENETDDKLQARRTQLSNVIISTLRQYPMLCYFQGYHDIVQVLLLVLGEELSQVLVPRLSILRIRDFMLPVLSPSFQHLRLLPAIVTAVDPKLARHLAPAQPFFALSSTLTMFAHDIEDYQMIARLFDFLLAHEASLSMYLFAQITLSRRMELFEIGSEDPDMLHYTLSKLPRDLDMDRLIMEAMQTFKSHPPETLPMRAWASISQYSVLKTTRSNRGNGIIATPKFNDCIKLFQKQDRQVKRQQLYKQLRRTLWKYRRPIGATSLAILAGILSIWLQYGQHDISGMSISTFYYYLRSWI